MKELIINVNSNEITIALTEDKQLVELHREHCKTGFAVGDILLGKVKKIMPGLNAAFVNVGYEKDAFIHYLDLGPAFNSMHKFVKEKTSAKKGVSLSKMKLEPIMEKSGKISSQLTTGDSILVQIAKEAISTKGPRLTSDISLAGRHVVLIPFSNKVSISQKVRSKDERKRLTKIVNATLPKNFGAIVRTAAVGHSDADIEQDILTLLTRWDNAVTRLKTETPPALLVNEMSRATTIIRDLLNVSFAQIVTDDKTIYEEIKEYIKTIAPEKTRIVKLYKGTTPIFDNFDISKQIKSLFAKFVSLKRGAYLIIEHTEAMHVVDVNSGNRTKVENDQEKTAMDVNLAAAEEIARQLRLRDMGGIIVVDFIDLHNADNRQILLERMIHLMSTDRAKHTILPLSKFGLMQITRQRVRPEMEAEVNEVCPTCNGTGNISPTILLDKQIEDRVEYFAKETGIKQLTLRVSPFVAAFLTKGLISLRRRWSMRYGCKITIIPDQSIGFIETKFFDKEDNELK